MQTANKSNSWMLLVTSNNRGDMKTHVTRGFDAEIAFEEMQEKDHLLRQQWLMHWERGFASASEANSRAERILADLQAPSADVAHASEPDFH